MENSNTRPENKASATEPNVDNSKLDNNQDTFLGSILTFIFWLMIFCAFLWNWDGFWQTDIKGLNNIQEKYFSNKYKEEQLKISRVTQNVKVIERIRERTEQIEERLNNKLIKVEHKLDNALTQNKAIKEELTSYLNQENLKCRYYDSSLRIIDHLSRKYSEEELKRTVACTNIECENIFFYRAKAKEICG